MDKNISSNENEPILSPRLVHGVILSTLILIILGSAIRINHSGLSCPDWPLCYSLYLPTYSKVSILEEQVGYTYSQIILEWGHRVLAAILVGPLVCLLITQNFSRLRHSKYKTVIIIVSLWMLILLSAQIFLGNLTVLEQNIPWSVALHLGAALSLYGLIICTYVFWTPKTKISFISRYLALGAYINSMLLMITGAMTGVLGQYKHESVSQLLNDIDDPILGLERIHWILAFLFCINLLLIVSKVKYYRVHILALIGMECVLGVLHYLIGSTYLLTLAHQVVALLIFSITAFLFWTSILKQSKIEKISLSHE